MKKLLSVLLVISIALSLLSVSVVMVNASTSSQPISKSTIEKRIDELYSKLGNKYFTSDQKSASSSSSRSLNTNVISSTWFKNSFGLKSLSVNQFPESPRTYAEGKSCSGFATFAEWYIFRNKDTDSVRTTESAKMDFNYNNVINNARIGDIISLSGKKANGESAGHELIIISADKNGIYVLDSNWGNQCKVTKHTIEYSYCSTFQIGRAKNSNAPSFKSTPIKPPTVTVTSYPTSIKKGSNHGLRGTINANGGSTEVRGYIINKSTGKTVQSTTTQTTSSSLDIRYSNINNQLIFNNLSTGTYTLKITAKNSAGTTEFKKDFKVTGVKPTINVTSYPTSIKKGSNYGLRGSINANGSSTEVKGYIINSSGKTVQSTTAQKTTSSSFDIRYSNVNNQLIFNNLSRGTYTLKITAKNSAGTTTFSKQFTVK